MALPVMNASAPWQCPNPTSAFRSIETCLNTYRGREASLLLLVNDISISDVPDFIEAVDAQDGSCKIPGSSAGSYVCVLADMSQNGGCKCQVIGRLEIWAEQTSLMIDGFLQPRSSFSHPALLNLTLPKVKSSR